MPAIWNVNKGYDVNNKKVSSKLTFEVGEKFNGRIVDKADGNEVLVKLADGWQFTAEVDGDFNLENQGLIKFAVEGFDNGKLKLKIIQGEQKGKNLSGDSLLNFIESEGLSKGDMELLLSMTKHNIPLTRENIVYIKSVIQFNEKINQNPQEIKEFIDKLIAGKGIDPQGEKAKDIQNVLRDFFNSFKNLSHEDILLFVENNIEINKDNIESFNKLFKGNGTIKEYIDSVGKELKNLQEEIPNSTSIKEYPKEDKNYQVEESPKNIYTKSDNSRVSHVDSQIASKAYDSNETIKSKTNIMTLLKTMMNTETALIKEPLKNILSVRSSSFNFNDYNSALSKLDNLSDSVVLETVKENSKNQMEFTKDTLNKVVSNIFNKDINLTEPEFKKITNMLSLILEESVSGSSREGNKVKNNNQVGANLNELVNQFSSDSDFEIIDGKRVQVDNKVDIKLQDEMTPRGEGRFTNQPILNDDIGLDIQTSPKGEVKLQDETTFKGEGKLTGQPILNDASDIDFQANPESKVGLQDEHALKGEERTKAHPDLNNVNDTDWKTNTQEETGVKEQSSTKREVNAQKQETLQKDTDLFQNNNNLNKEANGKIEENNLKDLIFGKHKQQSEGINYNERINKEGDLSDLLDKSGKVYSKDLIKNDIKVKLDDMKEIIKELIDISHNEKTDSKVMELIKGNINDFKLFNSISNEYYYLDIPIKQNNNEYPCKLIIKDNRKDGKKIDRNNIKMVVSVKTINLGNIDGYLKVKDLTLDIDIKCEEKYLKVVDMGKEKLVNGLKNLGFFVNVIVSKKNEEVDITTCRDFFNNSNSKAIDIKV